MLYCLPDPQQSVEGNDTGDSHSFLPVRKSERNEDAAIRAAVNGEDPLDWPTIAGQPINEFQTSLLATLAFPTLFPHGTGDPTNSGRQREVTLTDGFKHLIKYGECSTNDTTIQWRFASHPRFPYWALDMKQRHQLLSQAKVYLHQHPADANLTIEALRDMVGTLNAQQLMNRLQRYAAKIQGSNQYWYQRYQELRALLEQKGSPTFFWTVSAADTYWPELHSLMPLPPVGHQGHHMRVHALINNPHLADWYFTSKLSDWVKQWLCSGLDADWYWYRFEYQARLSIHAHGCAKLRNDPGICDLVQKAAIGWLAAEQIMDDSEQCDLLQLIQDGEEAKCTALQYSDWLVTTCNDAMPDDTWRLPHPHPSAKHPTEITDEDEDYHDLVNSVQRHTRCSAAYCLRRKPGQGEAVCRFGYPRDVQQSSELTFEKLQDGTIRATLTTRRNDPRVNSHNRVMLQHWRANVDLQVIVDVHACARYMAKYAAKGEPQSQPVSAILKTCVDRLHDDSDARTALRSAILRAVGERDFGSQETAHMLLSLPLVSCTYTFVTLSLLGGRRLKDDHKDGEDIADVSSLDQYAARVENLSLNLCTFVSQYTTYHGEVRKRTTPVIVRTFPTFSSDPHGELYGQYCKYQLLKYKPWTGNPSNAWGGGEDSDEVCIAAYMAFLQTDTAANYIPQFSHELDRVRQHYECQSDDSEDEHAAGTDDQTDEWMLLCRYNLTYTFYLCTNLLCSCTASTLSLKLHLMFATHSCRLNQRFEVSHTPPQDGIDWSEGAHKLEPATLRQCTTWIATQRRETPDYCHSRQLPLIDTATLNTEQHLAYDIITSHHRQLTADQHPQPLQMIVSGTAGTGKSYLISAISNVLGDSCLLTGTTGMAGFNIAGRTIHSALQLPV